MARQGVTQQHASPATAGIAILTACLTFHNPPSAQAAKEPVAPADGGALTPSKPGVLEPIAKLMGEVGGALLRQRSGDRTQGAESAILDALTRLIDTASPPTGSNGRPRDQQDQNQGKKQPQPKPREQESKPQVDHKPSGSKKQDETDAKDKEKDKKEAGPSSQGVDKGGTLEGEIGDLEQQKGGAWGQLPPHLREQLIQGLREEVPEKYKKLLMQYYRALAEEGE